MCYNAIVSLKDSIRTEGTKEMGSTDYQRRESSEKGRRLVPACSPFSEGSFAFKEVVKYEVSPTRRITIGINSTCYSRTRSSRNPARKIAYCPETDATDFVTVASRRGNDSKQSETAGGPRGDSEEMTQGLQCPFTGTL